MKRILTGALVILLLLLISAAIIGALSYLLPFAVGVLLVVVIILVCIPLCWGVGAIVLWLSRRRKTGGCSLPASSGGMP